jgi:hypothetical protein
MNITADSPPKVGGTCEYKDYEGFAKIVSVQKADLGNAAESRKLPTDSYKVTYTFHPDMKIQEPFVHLEARNFILLMPDSTYPDALIIQKNNIVSGKKLNCVLKVITKGACTPMIFIFPTLK